MAGVLHSSCPRIMHFSKTVRHARMGEHNSGGPFVTCDHGYDLRQLSHASPDHNSFAFSGPRLYLRG